MYFSIIKLPDTHPIIETDVRTSDQVVKHGHLYSVAEGVTSFLVIRKVSLKTGVSERVPLTPSIDLPQKFHLKVCGLDDYLVKFL